MDLWATLVWMDPKEAAGFLENQESRVLRFRVKKETRAWLVEMGLIVHPDQREIVDTQVSMECQARKERQEDLMSMVRKEIREARD